MIGTLRFKPMREQIVPPAVPIVDQKIDKPQTFISNFSSSNCVIRTWTDGGDAPLRHI